MSSPIVAVVREIPHPAPTDMTVSNFVTDKDGLVYDCGPQKIFIVDQTLGTGVLSDFISISKLANQWTLTIAATNFAQASQTYTLQL